MIQLLYIDLFCGAGGTSTGVNSARVNGEPCAEVVACVNHDAKTIASHASNHPNALHFTEDIRTMDLSPLVSHLEQCRKEHPEALVVLWASLECTNFSNAKGGRPRDADSRTLAEHLFRYIEVIDPDYIQIENVEEFMSWGALDENGKPLSKDRGRCYVRWRNQVKRYGYDFDFRILNAADYGAYTSRKRFFGIFVKHGLPIAFPQPTHSKKGEPTLFGNLKQWKPVREVLDFNYAGTSIFGRKKPLAAHTLERIYAGLIKFVAGGKEAFMVKYNSRNQRGKYVPPSVDEPCPTVTTQNRLAIAEVSFLSKQFSGSPNSRNVSVEEPAGTITTIDHHALVQAKRFVLNYRFNNTGHAIEDPAPTICTVGQIGIASCKFIVKTNDIPSFVNLSKSGEVKIEIYDTDSPIMAKIKKFMLIYNIIDITIRMLKIDELKRIMGFPEDYVLIGTQADQMKFIGNAVEVNMARVLCEALCKELIPIK